MNIRFPWTAKKVLKDKYISDEEINKELCRLELKNKLDALADAVLLMQKRFNVCVGGQPLISRHHLLSSYLDILATGLRKYTEEYNSRVNDGRSYVLFTDKEIYSVSPSFIILQNHIAFAMRDLTEKLAKAGPEDPNK